MNRNYEDLYIAIWLQAVKDETAKAAGVVTGYAFLNAYADYCNSEVKPLPENSKEVRKIKRGIYKEAKKRCNINLIPRIKKLIMAETKSWPNNIYEVNKDTECKAMLAALKKEVLVYARERFKKNSEQEG